MKYLALAVMLAMAVIPSGSRGAVMMHEKTNWEIRTSMVFDALCLMNTLSGDSFYLDYYQSEYNALAPKLTPAARSALAKIKHEIKDEGHGIISASLCLYFSAVNDTTLDQLLATAAQPAELKAALEQTPYYSDEDWRTFDSLRTDLSTVFTWMKEIHFDEYWRMKVLPKLQDKIRTIERDLPKYNVIHEDETMLGAGFASDKITVYMLYYSQPHGIKIVGTRFLTDMAWPFKIVLRNAVHEMLHPPFDLAADTELVSTLATLKADSFLMNKVLHHNPDFGYNTFDGFIEEDCVQAIEQTVNRNLKVAVDPRERWKESDDGMHVFAVALYKTMAAENYNAKHERFRDFLIRMIRSGLLAAGTIEGTYDSFYAKK